MISSGSPKPNISATATGKSTPGAFVFVLSLDEPSLPRLLLVDVVEASISARALACSLRSSKGASLLMPPALAGLSGSRVAFSLAGRNPECVMMSGGCESLRSRMGLRNDRSPFPSDLFFRCRLDSGVGLRRCSSRFDRLSDDRPAAVDGILSGLPLPSVSVSPPLSLPLSGWKWPCRCSPDLLCVAPIKPYSDC